VNRVDAVDENRSRAVFVFGHACSVCFFVAIFVIFVFMRLDSNLTTALYKSFTYLLIYLLTYDVAMSFTIATLPEISYTAIVMKLSKWT